MDQHHGNNNNNRNRHRNLIVLNQHGLRVHLALLVKKEGEEKSDHSETQKNGLWTRILEFSDTLSLLCVLPVSEMFLDKGLDCSTV